jgi:Flavodoxin domain
MALKALVVYESIYGNTRQIAEAIADGLAGNVDVSVLPVSEVSAVSEADVLVVGGPTHMHGMTTGLSRRLAVEGAHEDEEELDPSATEGEGLRQWLRGLPHRDGLCAAAFDTRLDRSAAMTGSAARGIGRRLRHRGYDVMAQESFFVDDAEGPLADGELERARALGSTLAGQFVGAQEKSRA